MIAFFSQLDSFVWGPPLLILLVGTGIYLSVRLGLLQITKLPKAFQLILLMTRVKGIFPVLRRLQQLLVLVISLV